MQDLTPPTYPGILLRIQALFADQLVVIAGMILLTFTFSVIGDVPVEAKMVGFVLIVLLYDPLCTSILGGTLGHRLIGIRVKREYDDDRNILFPLAVLRYVFKILLGWVSLLSIGSNPRRRAIHDILSGSIVIFKE